MNLEAGPFVSLSKQHLESSKHTKTLSKEEKKQHDAQPCKREPSIFEKTIDNMWFLVIAINPAIALGTLGVVELPEILANQSNILSVVGYRAGGDWLRIFIAVDAVLVLAGGVLTAFVGVTGLIRQLASDRCLPSFLLQTNTYFHTYHWIIIFFFLLCCMLYLITNGDVTVLSGVFSVSFLMVLILFATANIFLKYYRPNLPRAISIDWISLLLGWAVMVVGLIGNIIFNVEIVIYFIIYLVFYFSVIIITFQRTQFLKLALFFLEQSPSLEVSFTKPIRDALIACKNHTVVFFAKTSDIHVLNKAILYTRDNELCDRVIIIHVVTPNSELLSPPSSPTTKTMMSHHKTDGTDDGDEVNPFSDGYNRLIVSEDNEIELTLKQKKTAETKLDDVSEAFDLSEIDLEQKEQPQDEQDEHVYHHGLTSDMMSTWNTMQNFKENLALLDHVYPKMKLDLLLIHYQEFSPELVLKLSEDLNIKPSFMFIRCPNERFPYHLGQFEGVRTIMK